MTSAIPFDKRLQDVRGRLNAIRADLASGRPVDAAPLAAEVRALCQDISAAPRRATRSTLNELVALYDEIEQLSGAIRVQQSEIEKRLADLAAGRRAARAYGGPTPKR